ncbi:E3 ubiquitin-protein ligase dtx3l [Desmophyllum pertusum]|uniref:E3 ubiquitin-protein ligase n=1 Tax=Desmophyllum pertusum TaxID=174260 RepID=A0A9W9Z5K4_9CNID|nr:E3 ubiquitin-protein ligase dtx3l [Desmophyllum pertusum]
MMGTNEGGTLHHKCPICLDTMVNPRTIKCGHVFCEECLKKALGIINICPICKEAQGIVRGNQPPGQMTWSSLPSSLPGHYGCGTICIQYSFSPGIQGPEHPNPRQPYSGTSRIAYLPDNYEGKEVLQLLHRAFNARLVFTVGTSITTGLSNQITWNDIHHKTNTSGGSHSFGYPDPSYLQRVKEDLAAKGIR